MTSPTRLAIEAARVKYVEEATKNLLSAEAFHTYATTVLSLLPSLFEEHDTEIANLKAAASEAFQELVAVMTLPQENVTSPTRNQLIAALEALYSAYCSQMRSEYDSPGKPWTPERDNDEAALLVRAVLAKTGGIK